MQLSEFATIEDAKAYEATRPSLVAQSTMLGYLDAVGALAAVKKMSEDYGHDFQGSAIATLKSPEFNFQTDSPRGQYQISRLDEMIEADISIDVNDTITVNLTAPLTALKAKCIAECNQTYKPYENVTQHEFAKAKGLMAYKQVSCSGGWVSITTNADCEAHRPQVFAEAGRKPITTFGLVEKAGGYDAQIPTRYQTVYVENHYSVII